MTAAREGHSTHQSCWGSGELRCAWTHYRIPLANPFATRHGGLAVREGLLLRVQWRGLTAYGEAAPVPGFGHASAGELIEQLVRRARAFMLKSDCTTVAFAAPPETRARAERQLTPTHTSEPDVPAASAPVRAALDIACLDLLAQNSQQPVAALLAASFSTQVPVNAVVGLAEARLAAQAAAAAVTRGFACVKLKVGLCSSLEEEAERVAAVRGAIGPHIRLRLDANGAWPLELALDITRRLEPQDIELLEQPTPAGDLAALAALHRASPIRIAADESVSGPEQASELIAARAADVLVIKPMAAGGLRAGAEIARLAAAAGLGSIVTSSIDSGVGVLAALHLAAACASPNLACGLATAELLASDLMAEPIPVVEGQMALPAEPGLGFIPSAAALARYTTGWHEVEP
ncbi:MAG TPA: enolase C-terminal domain-like protein [Chloroflexota bacterium]|nr:enolase C-terminal domain-like protein [Chloroflexota bacterium]